MKKRMIIVVGPSGVGKSSFVDRAIEERDDLVDVVTYTTRTRRESEVEGLNYHFVSQEKFTDLVKQNFFVEWAHVHSNRYGTPKDQILSAWEKGEAVIMDLDVQGARSCKAEYPEALTVFIMPPSIDELRRRIEGRSAKLPSDFEIRMENARNEMEISDQFDRQVLNDEFEISYQQFKKIVEDYCKNG